MLVASAVTSVAPAATSAVLHFSAAADAAGDGLAPTDGVVASAAPAVASGISATAAPAAAAKGAGGDGEERRRSPRRRDDDRGGGQGGRVRGSWRGELGRFQGLSGGRLLPFSGGSGDGAGTPRTVGGRHGGALTAWGQTPVRPRTPQQAAVIKSTAVSS